jgi:hypothetical protein
MAQISAKEKKKLIEENKPKFEFEFDTEKRKFELDYNIQNTCRKHKILPLWLHLALAHWQIIKDSNPLTISSFNQKKNNFYI